MNGIHERIACYTAVDFGARRRFPQAADKPCPLINSTQDDFTVS
jgi:hypothetical protein